MIGQLFSNTFLIIQGRNNESTWFVGLDGGTQRWVAATVIKLYGPCSSLSVVAAPPPPTTAAAPTDIPTATPPAPTVAPSFTPTPTPTGTKKIIIVTIKPLTLIPLKSFTPTKKPIIIVTIKPIIPTP